MSKLVSFITIAALTVAGVSSASYAQTTAPAKAQATAPAKAQSAAVTATAIAPEKLKLINRVLELWPVEKVGLVMLEKPVAESLRQSRSLLQGRVSTETQDATMKEITQDAMDFLKEVSPAVIDSAHKQIPVTVVPLLADKFTEEELRQIIAILESPVKSKFEKAAPEIEAALGQKLAVENGPTINPKMTELTEKIGMRMRNAMNPK